MRCGKARLRAKVNSRQLLTMNVSTLKCLFLKISFYCLLSATCYGEMDVIFSPDSDIQELLVDNISRSENRIDLAISNLSSGKLTQALTDAKVRGVDIRMVVDYQHARPKSSVVALLKEEGLKIKVLKGKAGGRMNNNFAVFDDKLLVTGTYDWTNKATKYSHENVVISDDPSVVDSYHKEFERLYAAKDQMAWASPEAVSTSGLSRPWEPARRRVRVPFSKGEIPSPRDMPFPESSRGGRAFVDVTVEELNLLFGPESTLSKKERNELWKSQYKGKYVRWNGVIVYRGMTNFDWYTLKMGFDVGEKPEATVIFKKTYLPQLTMLKEGDVIAYTARLNKRKSFGSLYRLDNGDILGKLMKMAPRQ